MSKLYWQCKVKVKCREIKILNFCVAFTSYVWHKCDHAENFSIHFVVTMLTPFQISKSLWNKSLYNCYFILVSSQLLFLLIKIHKYYFVLSTMHGITAIKDKDFVWSWTAKSWGMSQIIVQCLTVSKSILFICLLGELTNVCFTPKLSFNMKLFTISCCHITTKQSVVKG
jgi:hypothetical protein